MCQMQGRAQILQCLRRTAFSIQQTGPGLNGAHEKLRTCYPMNLATVVVNCPAANAAATPATGIAPGVSWHMVMLASLMQVQHLQSCLPRLGLSLPPLRLCPDT
jgi:hypothetical protein